MSASAAYFDGGGLDAIAVFPEEPGLLERGRRDGIDRLCVDCAARGELYQAGLKVSDIGALLGACREQWGDPGPIVCDRWREAELRQALRLAEFPVCPLVTRGKGFLDRGQDVREFRRACLDGHVQAVRSLLLWSAISGARVTSDAAGNAKLANGGQGRRTRCRDHAAAAAILAVAEGQRRAAQAEARPAFQYAIV